MSILAYYLERGWTEQRDQFKPYARMIYSPRSLTADLRHCACNEKPPSVFLWEYPPHEAGMAESYEVEIRGEWDGIWLKLCAYSLQNIYEIEKAIMALRDAWQAQGALAAVKSNGTGE